MISAVVQAVCTFVLMVITGFYAWQTYRTNAFIFRQVSPKIKLEPLKFNSRLPTIENLKKLAHNKGRSFYISFQLEYRVTNSSAAYGTVFKPKLVINMNEKIWELKPHLRRSDELVFESSIYLMPGERRTMDENYDVLVSHEDHENYLSLTSEFADKLKYSLIYEDENEKIQTLDLSHLV